MGHHRGVKPFRRRLAALSLLSFAVLAGCIPAPTPKENTTAYFVAKKAGLKPTDCYVPSGPSPLACKTSKGVYSVFAIERSGNRSTVRMRRERPGADSFLTYVMVNDAFSHYRYAP